MLYPVYTEKRFACRNLQDSLQAKDALITATAKSLRHKDHSPTKELSRKTQALDDVVCKLSLGQKGLDSRITALEKRLALELDDEDTPAQHLLTTYRAPAETIASSCTFMTPLWANVN
jgi:hypothetical protein